MKKFAFILTCLLMITGPCASAIDRSDSLKAEANKVASSSQFDFIGGYTKDGERFSCCVLIDKKYALTTAGAFLHLLNKTSTDNSSNITNNLSRFKVIFGDDTVKIVKYQVHPSYSETTSMGSGRSGNIGQYNAVILELDKPIRNIVPASLCNSGDEMERKAINVRIDRNIKKTDNGIIDSISRSGEFVNIAGMTGGIEKGKETLLISFSESPDISKMKPMPQEEVELNRRYNLHIPCGLYTENNGEWELTGMLTLTNHSFNTGSPNNIENPPKDEARFVRISSIYKWLKKEINIK